MAISGNVTPIKIIDTTVCSSSSVLLNAGTAVSYTWSTGSNTQTISVNNAGTYWVQVNPLNGCTQIIDTFYLHLTAPPTTHILKDTTVCSNVNYVLNALQANATHYLWSTGATSYSINPISNGIYWVDINMNQCVVRDSAQITLVNPPVLNLLKDTFICNMPISLVIIDTSLMVSWSTGNHTNQITIGSIGTYSVSVTKNGCTTTTTFTVRNMEFNTTIIVPNIITPNGDNINDFFEFNAADLVVKEFKLYNRWGELIYSPLTRQLNGMGNKLMI